MHLSALLIAALCVNQALAGTNGGHGLKKIASKMYVGVPTVGPSNHAIKIHQKLNKTHISPKNGTHHHENIPKIEQPSNGTHPHDVKTPESPKPNHIPPVNGTEVKKPEVPKPNTPIVLPTNATKHDKDSKIKDHKPSPAPAPPGKAHPRDFAFAF